MTIWQSIVAIIICSSLKSTAKPSDDYTQMEFHGTEATYDEYFIEHEISARDARLFAGSIDPNTIEIPAGCKACSNEEIRYCLGPSLMNDHCCCDRRFKEMFKHIPHTCYIGKRLCQPIARDCGEYARLRACCCDRHVAFKWKQLAEKMSNNAVFNQHWYIIAAPIVLLLI